MGLRLEGRGLTNTDFSGLFREMERQHFRVQVKEIQCFTVILNSLDSARVLGILTQAKPGLATLIPKQFQY